MGLKITTDDRGIKVYRKDNISKAGNPYSRFFIMTSSKNQDGSFTSAYTDVLFKKADADKITNKCVIKINNAFPTVSEWNDVKTIKYFIMDFEVITEGEKPVNAEPNDVDFVNLDDIDDDEFPFV